ncbi:choice-of-anchor M domain-containing protein [Corynebacterium caspium]|uniref:choice-of-anchor M domain-containing protein n=1 Tax=Corynebacterium caspium TaxID=234828 RepID=UPI0003A2C44D|nr:choice-of-anchor M domain-containing protein [Corynebacterium caspium]WKD58934.1 hypothetical protein CCASP_02635 [Corynebacterium caspium DSM 44850]
MRRVFRLLSSLLLATVLVLLGRPALAQEVFTEGHLDAFYVTAPGGVLTLSMKEDITGDSVIRPGNDVLLQIPDTAYSEETSVVPGIGAPTYYLPQSQVSGLLWPGWDTQPVREAGIEAVDLVFKQVSGPGAVYVFEANSFGAVSGVTTDGNLQLSSGSVISQPYPAHRHVNWAFSQPGRYSMTVEALADGQRSNTVTYSWQVGSGATTSGAANPAPGTAGANQANHANQAQSGNFAGPIANAPAAGRNPGAAGNPPAAPLSSNTSNADAGASAANSCGLSAKIRDDSVVPPRWIDAQGATFYLGKAAEVQLPQQVGTVPAGKAWMIGSTQIPNVPWLGASTQHPNGPGPVTWQLSGYNGPGNMAVYTQGGLGQVVGNEWFSATPTQAQTQQVFLDRHTHVHPNWVFSAPGTYHVTITQQATESNRRATATLVFQVGGDAPAGSFGSGHFDLAAEINDAVNCAEDAAGVAAGNNNSGAVNAAATNSASSNNSTTAAVENTASKEPSKGIIWALAFFGVSLLILGLGIIRYALVEAKK